MTDQPKALRLADELLFAGRFAHEHEDAAARRRINRNSEAAKELRRLHEVNQKLLEVLQNLCKAADNGHVASYSNLWDDAKAAIAKAEVKHD